MEFSLYREEEGDMVEGVENFKYLGQTINQTDDDWPVVRQNILRTRLVWGRLGALMRREGSEHKVSEFFYREVVQAVLLFGTENWILLAAIERKSEVSHTCFLQHITGKQAPWLAYGTWKMPRTEVVQEAAGTNSVMTYIGRQQTPVTQWVALRTIFEVCAGKTGYKGRGCRREAWWRQVASDKQLRATVVEISREARSQKQW